MTCNKKIGKILLGVLWFVMEVWIATPVYGAEQELITQEQIDETKESLLEDLELAQIEQSVRSILQDQQFSFSDLVGKLTRGEIPLDPESLGAYFQETLFHQFHMQRDTLLQLLVLLIASAVLMNLSNIFEKGQISDIAFFMVYLFVFTLLVKSFGALSEHLIQTLSGIVDFMKVLTPAYYLSIVAAGGAASGTAYYQGVLAVIFAIQWLLLKFVLPGINVYVLLGIVNHLSKEDFLSKMAELLKTILEWSLKTALGVIVGLQIIQKMVSPMIDSLQRTVVGRTASAIPGIGNAINSVTEMVLGCSMLIKNCLGAAALVVLILMALGPIIRLGVSTLLYKAIAAVAQPVSDKRMVGCLSAVGDGCALLFRTLLTTEILCFLTLAIVASGGA